MEHGSPFYGQFGSKGSVQKILKLQPIIKLKQILCTRAHICDCRHICDTPRPIIPLFPGWTRGWSGQDQSGRNKIRRMPPVSRDETERGRGEGVMSILPVLTYSCLILSFRPIDSKGVWAAPWAHFIRLTYDSSHFGYLFICMI